MIITATALAALRTGFKTEFQTGFSGVTSEWGKLATKVNSTTKLETYGWLGDFPSMREWIGDRVIKSLSERTYDIVNRKFEDTVGVKRDDIEDDTLGIYGPMFQGLGQSAAENADRLIFNLLAAGFTTPCHDGQNFFDADHLVAGESVSNTQAGAGDAWYLLDTSRPLKPMIYQQRKAANFVARDQEKDDAVFNRGEYVYGVDTREAAGFGFWQMAFGSKAALTPDSYAAAVAAMTSLTNDAGSPLGVQPNLLVVGGSNKAAGRKVLKVMLIDGGDSNIWFEDSELLESRWLK
jgi:phage major head subunit gpT-like protein